jgi:hypothetical protein
MLCSASGTICPLAMKKIKTMDRDGGMTKRIKLEDVQTNAAASLTNQGKETVGGDMGVGKLDTFPNAKTPNDFWYWLPPDQPVRDNDVICGRGGESNNYVGNKKFRIVIKDRKVSSLEKTPIPGV